MIIKIKYRILIDVIYSSTFYFSLFSHTHSLRSERENERGREERENERGSKKERKKFTVFFLPTDIHHHHHSRHHHHPSDECRRKKTQYRESEVERRKCCLTINLQYILLLLILLFLGIHVFVCCVSSKNSCREKQKDKTIGINTGSAILHSPSPSFHSLFIPLSF